MPAPIALFAYNRPSHALRTIEALKANELASESDLFLFSDGPKGERDRYQVEATRKVLESVTGFKSVTCVFSPQNRGLATSIISGVTLVTEKFGRVIVLEDDLVPSPGFLRYMNDGLDKYADDDRVISIHGYVYPVSVPLPETFFLKGADCWGWATWKRGWDLFESDGNILRAKLRLAKLSNRFDFEGAYSYSSMLDAQVAGKNDSWAIRWYASALIQNKLTLYPGQSLIFNIGNDGGGTNVGQTPVFDVEVNAGHVHVGSASVSENIDAYAAFVSYFRRTEKRQSSNPRRLKVLTKRIYSAFKKVVYQIVPPILPLLFQSLRPKPESYGFFGDYKDWESASKATIGYDSDTILAKVRDSVLAVKDGRAAYERDSVLFQKPEYPWQLLGCLFSIASQRQNRLSVLDFGGSLGSTYFQCKPMLMSLDRLEWSIVEQTNFVTEGRRVIADDQIKFYFEITDCLSERKPDVLLLSCVLAYLPDPYAYLDQLIGLKFPYILFDRTPFLPIEEDRLTIQKVPPFIYTASYPAWFFSERKLRMRMSQQYDLIVEFDSFDRVNLPAEFKGFLFKLRETK